MLDAALDNAQAVVILLTGDDEARLREPYRGKHDPAHETDLTPQARPNVIFEAGMALGRAPDRTIIVELGKTRPFSDIGGRHTVRFTGSAEHRQRLKTRLKTAGCEVDDKGTDWLRAGDFEAALKPA